MLMTVKISQWPKETPESCISNGDYKLYLLEIRWDILTGKMYFSNIGSFTMFSMYLFGKKIIMAIYGAITAVWVNFISLPCVPPTEESYRLPV